MVVRFKLGVYTVDNECLKRGENQMCWQGFQNSSSHLSLVILKPRNMKKSARDLLEFKHGFTFMAKVGTIYPDIDSQRQGGQAFQLTLSP